MSEEDETQEITMPEQPSPVIVIRFPSGKPIEVNHEGLNDFMLPTLLRKVANQMEKSLTNTN